MNRAHRQADYAVRLEWGPAGAAAIAPGAGMACVVDVLTFTTAVTVAAEHGVVVLPFRWRDARAASYAAAHDATLATGRSEAAGPTPGRRPGPVSLSPASLVRPGGPRRVVLPSPNGSSIAAALAGSGLVVVAACLRNAAAVAAHLHHGLASGPVAIVPAGERWPDGSLRPAAEDLWGAGAVVSALLSAGVATRSFSPEAQLAAGAYDAVRDPLTEHLGACASGRELVEAGFADDLTWAAEADDSSVVPVLRGPAFEPAALARPPEEK